LGGRVGEAEGSGRERYGVLKFVPEDGWEYRVFLQEVQKEIGLSFGRNFCWVLGDLRRALQAMSRARASSWWVLVSRFCSSVARISSRGIWQVILLFLWPKWTHSRFTEVVAKGRVRQAKCYRKALSVASG